LVWCSARLLLSAASCSPNILWQESFDHLVRSADQFESLRSYIASNPAAAGLRPEESRRYERK